MTSGAAPRLAARLSKLRAMSAREVAVRARYAAYCRLERLAHQSGRLADQDRLRQGLIGTLQSGDWKARLLESRAAKNDDFFSGASDRARMRELFETRFSRERAAALEAANLVLSGSVEFFGERFPLASPVAWNHDPVSGTQWPRRYHRDVPIHGGNRGWGDVKYVWELNRQQFLVDLGRGFFLTRDSRYAARARDLVVEWIRDNPYGTGVNWACALEPAFRVLSWLWTYFLCFEDEQRHPEHQIEWLTGFYDHGRFLYRHLEHYASPYNHLIGEASALYQLGVLFPEFSEAAGWRRRGRHVLESRLSGQFYADGGSVEQSTFYHHATLAFYLLAAVLGRRHGEEFSPAVWTAIERATEFSAALVQPDGRVPAIGGADDGKPLRMEHLPFWNFRPFQAIGSVLFDRPDFKSVAERFYEDALWLLGPDGLARFDALASTPASAASIALGASGYYILRSDRTPTADFVCVDCGPQAGDVRTDAVPNSVHGHADCLSIVVALGGRPVLVDAGLFCYNGDPAWESHFRRTAAHNTARIDNADQALHHGKMAWSHSYIARAELWMPHGEAAFIGSHDGYVRRGGDTRHRRLVWLRPGGYLIVYDEFECERDHDVELNFQFAPGGTLSLVNPSQACYEGVTILWFADRDLDLRTSAGGPSPEGGWVAPSLGVLRAAPRLSLMGRISPPRSANCTLFAASGIEARRLTASLDSGQPVVVIKGSGFEDYVSMPGMGGALESSKARVAIRRGRDGAIVSLGV